jgi:hypothetical protein
MTPEQERIERLERALLELVYYNEPGPYSISGWCVGIRGDENVDDIIGDLLDKYKPTNSSL